MRWFRAHRDKWYVLWKGKANHMRRSALSVLRMTGVCALCLGSVRTDRPLIFVGPNIVVSRDGDVPHVETTLAINSQNPKNLLGAAITLTGPYGGRGAACKTYASFDGGYTWTDATFPEQVAFGGADPQVAFGRDGTAYFVSLASVPDSSGMYFYRSADGGKTWHKPVYLGHGDHEMIAVDYTSSRYTGRLYITAETGTFADPKKLTGRTSTVILRRSEDDGRTFLAPAEVARTQGKGLMALNPLVLTDGTLFVPMREYPSPTEDQITPTVTWVFATSSDGGASFSAPTRILAANVGSLADFYARWNRGDLDVPNPVAVFAVDTRTDRYRDRLYMVWTDRSSGNSRVLFSYSSDRGGSWSRPTMVNPEVAGGAIQYQPNIAVNDQGIVGVTWFDTRNSNNREQYDLYFTASVDGGETLLPSVRVSSQSSVPAGTGNIQPVPYRIGSTDESIKLGFLSGFARWRVGGEYTGLVADDQGIFRPFWPDSRTGTFQVWTSQIRVTKPGFHEGVPVEKINKSINRYVTLVLDAVQTDTARQEAVLWIRLKNTSEATLYRPFTVEVKRLTDPDYPLLSNLGIVKRILNAANRKKGVGATFDYNQAMRDLDSLEPGGLTEAVPWRLQFDVLKAATFPIEVEATGFVSQQK